MFWLPDFRSSGPPRCPIPYVYEKSPEAHISFVSVVGHLNVNAMGCVTHIDLYKKSDIGMIIVVIIALSRLSV